MASANKRLRQSEMRKSLNRSRKAALKRVVKASPAHRCRRKSEAVSCQVGQGGQGVEENTIHKNRASRIKSRWVKKVQALED
jgi:ribosomal protein S20